MEFVSPNWNVRISNIVPKDQIWLFCPVTKKLLAVVKDVKFEDDQDSELKQAAKDIDCGH